MENMEFVVACSMKEGTNHFQEQCCSDFEPHLHMWRVRGCDVPVFILAFVLVSFVCSMIVRVIRDRGRSGGHRESRSYRPWERGF